MKLSKFFVVEFYNRGRRVKCKKNLLIKVQRGNDKYIFGGIWSIEHYIIMEEHRKELLTNKEVNMIQRYKSRIKEIEEENVCNKIVNR